ncbi:hypothetical protein BGZ70_002137 [Mortierella alpina]|uniref:Secreted protein n=1 Tax=Mortierella alpina TaxID=64518 RepID=A0A9P6IV24_MORAP|nr:hypothetical protein BGZ70_002137 [Mortierella alpina]
MHKQAILVFAFVVAVANAWSFTVWQGANKSGKYRRYFDVHAGNYCFNLDTEMTNAGIQSFSYCSMPWTRCSITIHSETGCNGVNLGSATGNAPVDEWNKDQTSAEGSLMKSFRIQGCQAAPIVGTIDCQKCSRDPF